MCIMPWNDTQPAPLAVDEKVLTRGWWGSQDAPGVLGCLSFTASQAGNGWFEARYVGNVRRISLRVVDPTAVVGLSVNNVFPSQTSPQNYVASVDTPTLTHCENSSFILGNTCTTGASVFGMEFLLADGSTATGFWGRTGASGTCLFAVRQALMFTGGLDVSTGDCHIGLFSLQGFTNGSCDWQMSAGTDDANLSLPTFTVPITVALENGYCTACGR